MIDLYGPDFVFCSYTNIVTRYHSVSDWLTCELSDPS